ncbi:hypothetical protein AB0302_03730 [Micrococcus sp. NPDC078436]|uniref:hypothetical protein n=1 Tax=Micrococcus sp. NPDC078436 TaxID=3154960 RepID=UPI00344BF465
MTPAGLLDTTPRRVARRRTVRTLAASQVFSGLGNGSALAVGSVMAVELSGHAQHDAGMGLAGAAGAGLAGVVLGVAGYGGLAVLSAMLALVVAAAALRGASPGPSRVRNADIR